MGSNVTGNYPASILSGLWSNTNNAFPTTPYPFTGQAATGAYGLASNNAGLGYQNSAASLGNISPGAVSNANNAYGALTGSGNNALSQFSGAAGNAMSAYQPTVNSLSSGLGSILGETQGSLTNYANQALQQGFDPQNALYNKEFAQQQQQSEALNAASGVGTTPYGAGLVNQGDQNFNIAWNQAQLQNQATASQTASNLLGTGYGQVSSLGNAASGAVGSQYGTYGNLLGQGYSQLGNLYNTGSGVYGGLTNAGATGLSTAGNYNTQAMNDYLAYLQSSMANSQAWNQAVTNDYAAATGQYSAQTSAGQVNNAANQSALSGLGSLGGLALGLAL